MRKKTTTQANIIHLKQKFNLKSSEELFGITPEMPLQCPRINEFEDDLDLLKKHFDKLCSLIKDKDNISLNAEYIEREIAIIEKYFEYINNGYEELRTACENLRNRGNGWKLLFKEAFPYIPNNVDHIDEKFKKQL